MNFLRLRRGLFDFCVKLLKIKIEHFLVVGAFFKITDVHFSDIGTPFFNDLGAFL